MRQSNIIFGTLVFAFVIYITLRGQLPDYLALFSSAPKGDTTNLPKADKSEKEQTSKETDWFSYDETKKLTDLYSNMGL